jgi:hypothetical protein
MTVSVVVNGHDGGVARAERTGQERVVANHVNTLGTEEEVELESCNIYLVRRLFCLARALLSTSGGILLATVSCECTRKARAGGLARLPVAWAVGQDGNGDEVDIANGLVAEC